MIRKAALSFLVGVTFLAGCGSTPKQRWSITQEGFNTTRKVVLDLHANQVIDDPTLVKLDKIEKAGRGALSVAYSQIPDGGDAFEDWLKVAQGSLVELAKTYGGEQ